MTAATTQYSLELPASNSTSINEVQEFDSQRLNSRIQLVAIAALLGGACALSAAGVLPAAVLVSCAVTATAFIVTFAAHKIFTCALNTEVIQERSEFFNYITNIPPYITCILVPIIEELIFRTLVQGGLYATLSYVLPATAVITVLGLEFPVAAVVSIVAAGVIFGLVHNGNHPDNPFANILHIAKASMTGVFVFGPLYYAFGLWASILAHIAQNTIVIGTCEAILGCQQVNSTDS